MPEAPQERGIWAERYVRDFLALPLLSEFVFRSLQTWTAVFKRKSRICSSPIRAPAY